MAINVGGKTKRKISIYYKLCKFCEIAVLKSLSKLRVSCMVK